MAYLNYSKHRNYRLTNEISRSISEPNSLIRQWKTKLTSQNRLSLLSTFEVAARHLSFKLAADELFLTPSAISHRIQQLEKLLGFRLFMRMTRKLALTEDGTRLLLTLTKSLRRIDDEIEDIRYNDLRGTLTLGIAPILGQLWLMPRLPDFQQRWPSLNVMLRVRAGTVDFNEEQIDLAILVLFAGGHLLIEDVPPIRNPIELQRLAVARLGKDVVDLEGVGMRFGEHEVLREVTWRIGPGERTGILGANGAGKSTLLMTLCEIGRAHV